MNFLPSIYVGHLQGECTIWRVGWTVSATTIIARHEYSTIVVVVYPVTIVAMDMCC